MLDDVPGVAKSAEGNEVDRTIMAGADRWEWDGGGDGGRDGTGVVSGGVSSIGSGSAFLTSSHVTGYCFGGYFTATKACLVRVVALSVLNVGIVHRAPHTGQLIRTPSWACLDLSFC